MSDFDIFGYADEPVMITPTGLQAVKTGAGVLLTWDNNAQSHEEFGYYRIYRRAVGHSLKVPIFHSVGLRLIDDDAEPGITYLYSISSVHRLFDLYESSPCEEVLVEPIKEEQ